MVRLRLCPEVAVEVGGFSASSSATTTSSRDTSAAEKHYNNWNYRVVVLQEGKTILGRSELLGIDDPEVALQEVEVSVSASEGCAVKAVGTFKPNNAYNLIH